MRNISREVIFTQDYTPENTITYSDGSTALIPERYSEFFTISKIDIESDPILTIENLQVQINPLKTKNPNQNPIKIAFLLSSDLDKSIFKLPIDYGSSESKTQIVFHDLSEIDVDSSDEIDIYPTDFELYSRERYGYFDIRDPSSNPDRYKNYSSFGLLQYEKVIFQTIIIGVTYSPSGKIILQNTSGSRFLYIIPFAPNLQYSRLAASCLLNFSLSTERE